MITKETYSYKELKELVILEAINLKNHATEMEKANLDFATFDKGDPQHCIYGQMTGDCRSSRALELLNRCIVPYSAGLCVYANKVEKDFQGYFSGFSPIEFYICRPKAKNKPLIDFLKGNRETLTIKDL